MSDKENKNLDDYYFEVISDFAQIYISQHYQIVLFIVLL